MRSIALALLLLLPPEDWKAAVPDYEWSFPEDHWPHDGYRTEWWYFTGHLESVDDPQKRFGYQFTFFRIGVLNDTPPSGSEWSATHAVMGHAAVTDLETGEHRFSEVLYRASPLLASFGDYPERSIVRSLGPAGTDREWTLEWNGNGFDFQAHDLAEEMSFALSTDIDKPMVFQGPGGYSPKREGPGAASQYYSFTRLGTTGEVTMDGARYRVRGSSWMDKEFSSSHLSERQVGWDWFSLQLDDGRELMLYLMRAGDGSIDYASGTLVGTDASVRYLAGDEFRVEPGRQWTSPETEASYPVSWTVTLDGLGIELAIRALVEDQENRSRLPGGVYYWEGAVSVEGDVEGFGYVELTGYGEGSRPPV